MFSTGILNRVLPSPPKAARSIVKIKYPHPPPQGREAARAFTSRMLRKVFIDRHHCSPSKRLGNSPAGRRPNSLRFVDGDTSANASWALLRIESSLQASVRYAGTRRMRLTRGYSGGLESSGPRVSRRVCHIDCLRHGFVGRAPSGVTV